MSNPGRADFEEMDVSLYEPRAEYYGLDLEYLQRLMHLRVGSQPVVPLLPLPVLYPSNKVKSFVIPNTPTVMCCLTTGPKAKRQLIMNGNLQNWAKTNLSSL